MDTTERLTSEEETMPSLVDKGMLSACAWMIKAPTKLHFRLETGTAVNITIISMTLQKIFP